MVDHVREGTVFLLEAGYSFLLEGSQITGVRWELYMSLM